MEKNNYFSLALRKTRTLSRIILRWLHLIPFLQGLFRNWMSLWFSFFMFDILNNFVNKDVAYNSRYSRAIFILKDGRRLRIDNINHIPEIWLDKTYEPSPSFRPQKDWVVIDMGACSGDFTVYASLRGASVFAFEPHPIHFETLMKNASVFSMIEPYNLALGSKKGTVVLHSQHPGAHSLTVSKKMLSGQNREYMVTVRRADDVIKKVGRVDLMKIDVEGSDLEALKGSRNLLKKTQRVVMEVHDDLLIPCEQLLQKAGFYTYSYFPDTVPFLCASREKTELPRDSRGLSRVTLSEKK